MPSEMKQELVAPCGMNCRLCVAFTRQRKPCPGCNGEDAYKPNHCVKCSLKNCPEMEKNPERLCGSCDKICRRLKDLDRRYQTKYHMSMLENLAFIEKHGMDAFLAWEKERWTCPTCGGIVSVHRDDCPECGVPVTFEK